MELTSPAARSGFAEIPALLLEDFFDIGAASEGEGIGEIAHPATQQVGQAKLAVFGPDLLDFLAGETASAAAFRIGLPRTVQELAIGSLDPPPFGAPPQTFGGHGQGDLEGTFENGRGDTIRTCDIQFPKLALV
jgi:hypothetical protein